MAWKELDAPPARVNVHNAGVLFGANERNGQRLVIRAPVQEELGIKNGKARFRVYVGHAESHGKIRLVLDKDGPFETKKGADPRRTGHPSLIIRLPKIEGAPATVKPPRGCQYEIDGKSMIVTLPDGLLQDEPGRASGKPEPSRPGIGGSRDVTAAIMGDPKR